jgi:hypothetical protein
MRTIKQTVKFKRDLKREARGMHRDALANDLGAALFGHAFAALNRQILTHYSFAASGMGHPRAR